MNTINIEKIIRTKNNFENYLIKKLFEQQNINYNLYYSNHALITVEHILSLIFCCDYHI